MTGSSLDANVDDKLSRLLPAYKQLVHYLAQNMSDEECTKRIRGAKLERVKQAVIEVANVLGVPEGPYEERRSDVAGLGRKFFFHTRSDEDA